MNQKNPSAHRNHPQNAIIPYKEMATSRAESSFSLFLFFSSSTNCSHCCCHSHRCRFGIWKHSDITLVNSKFDSESSPETGAGIQCAVCDVLDSPVGLFKTISILLHTR